MAAAAEAHPDQVVEICFGPVGMEYDWVMRRMLHEEKYLGDVRHVLLREYSGFATDPDAPLHWRMDERASGVNTLSVGIWVEVLNRWVGPAARRIAPRIGVQLPAERDRYRAARSGGRGDLRRMRPVRNGDELVLVFTAATALEPRRAKGDLGPVG